jgi:transcription termination factor Rho
MGYATSEGSDTNVTELQDQLDVLPRSTSAAGGETESQQRAKRRSGSLTAMLLPELQALAGSLGLPAAKLRKSELISAIQVAQSGAGKAGDAATGTRAPATRTRRAASRPAGTVEPSPTQEPARAESAPPRAAAGQTTAEPVNAAPANSRRTGSAPARDNAQTELPVSDDSGSVSRNDGTDERDTSFSERDRGDDAGEQPTSRRSRAERNQGARNGRENGRDSNGRDTQGRAQNGSATEARNADSRGNESRNGSEPRGNESRNAESRNAESRNAESRNAESRNAESRNAESRNGNDARNTDPRNATEPRNGSEPRNNARSNAPVDDDDEFGNSRRSRRYRDRRGRTRDRFEGGATGGSRQDVEPTVSDDDILIPVAGILDNVDDKNAWFIRVNGYFASPDDIYVANSHIRRYGLRRGDAVTGAVKQTRDGERKEKFNPLVRLDSVNGVDPELAKNRVEFTKLTPLYPQERLRLETEPQILTTRIIDLVMPIGKGQRALVVSPPKAGKTSVLQAIANAISVNNPECHLMVVLVDERPEEVTDMQRSVKGEVIASTFDRKPSDHTMIAELSIERAKRLVEMGHDVVVLLDSITRLGRAYNLAAPASGRILSGGVDSTALYPPKRFLGAARNIEDGGSLTIIATALVETGSTMDTVIFEEFKGTGNAELILDRRIADKRTFPAVDVDRSGTRKEEILMSPEELAVVLRLRRVLHALEPQQGIDLLLDRLKKSRTNIEFLMSIAKTAPGEDDR